MRKPTIGKGIECLSCAGCVGCGVVFVGWIGAIAGVILHFNIPYMYIVNYVFKKL